ncbi:DUF6460 domain-containing protein [Breoghania sp.]|uniref:DUF6460 domain-containing protein n=1 Tax=Breoghania sp. TaxID=2065378 RepID=UPI002AA63CB4|nr:DUF6460 domain-containing protein [Breoghania sp.]
MRNEKLTRFFGGSPGHVVLRLAVISFVVGIIMSSIDLYPMDLIYWIEDVVRGIWNMGFDAVRRFGSYFLLGAMVVVPIWLIGRFMKIGRGEP